MSQIPTLYGDINSVLLHRLSKVKLLACDVDGVFSDGRIYMGSQGEELKTFHTLDGYGVKALLSIGIEVIVITGRTSPIVQTRMAALGVKHIVQGQEHKQQALKELQLQLNVKPDQTAAIGDDMPDLGMFSESRVNFSVPNAHPFVKQQADYITERSGGAGAVREACDLILQAQDKLDHIYGASL